MKSGSTSPEISPNFKGWRPEVQGRATWCNTAGRVARQARKAARISKSGGLKPRARRLGATLPGHGLDGCEERRRGAVATGFRRVYRQSRSTAGSQLLRDSAAFIGSLGMPAGRRNRDLPPVSSSAKSSAATTAVGHRATRPGVPVQNGMSSSAKLLSASPPPAGLSGPAAGGCAGAGAGPVLAAGLPGESPAPLRLSSICISLATTSVV